MTHRAMERTSYRYSVKDFPPATSEDLDFEDPPPFLKSLIEQIFWCLSAKVRQIIKEKYPRRVFFCFYKGVCTWACEDNPAVAKERIQAHHQAKPHHYINPHYSHLREWLEEMDRRKCIRDELRNKKWFGLDYKYRQQEKSRDSSKRTPFCKGITYRYPDTQQSKRRLSSSRESRSTSRSSSCSRSHKKGYRRPSRSDSSSRISDTSDRKTEREDDSKMDLGQSRRETGMISPEISIDNFIESQSDSTNININKSAGTSRENRISCKPRVKSFSELVHEKLRINQMKQKKIIIGPRKGFKLTKQNLIRLEKLEQMKSQEVLEEESGTCKYCGESLPIKKLKDHYLNHSKEITRTTEQSTLSVSDNPMQDINHDTESTADDRDVILQENSISSSDNTDNTPDIDIADIASQCEEKDFRKYPEPLNFGLGEKHIICNEVSTTESQTVMTENIVNSYGEGEHDYKACNTSEKTSSAHQTGSISSPMVMVKTELCDTEFLIKKEPEPDLNPQPFIDLTHPLNKDTQTRSQIIEDCSNVISEGNVDNVTETREEIKELTKIADNIEENTGDDITEKDNKVRKDGVSTKNQDKIISSEIDLDIQDSEKRDQDIIQLNLSEDNCDICHLCMQ